MASPRKTDMEQLWMLAQHTVSRIAEGTEKASSCEDLVETAVISNSSNRPYPSGSIETLAKVNNEDNRPPADIASQNASQSATLSGIPCPRCTFLNHKSLASCEICGASLTAGGKHGDRLAIAEEVRAESPGPARQSAELDEVDVSEGLKLSFRAGGEKLFYERLQEALVQRKWLLQGAPPVPKPQQSYSETNHFSNAGDRDTVPSRPRTVGIAGLEQRGFDVRKNNEIIIGNAFEDLETLMASAKEIVALAETFSSKVNGPNVDPTSEASAVLSQSAAAIGLVTTKDMLGGGSKSETLYLSELARNLAEYLTDDATGVLRKEGGIMSLVDLWAVFNRARGGVELVSPTDFQKAASLWEKLKLPLRLRRFKSGLLVVQSREWNDDKTIASLLSWLQDLRWSTPNGDAKWDWRLFGRGITAQEAAERFGWSVGVANEELEMAEERGVLCREESIAGVYFWENWFTDRDTLRGFDRWFEEMLPWRAGHEQVI
ncbi:MAG: hypothetical protein M1825_005651 [Sarcosagium campestre]|nr:MAG: hypothetical protein M1825_005651 [Sarcosagium campestre]